MKKYAFLLMFICTMASQSFAQYYESRPHFFTFGGGLSRNNFKETKDFGYMGNVEGAYFFSYLFGAGLKVDYSYMGVLENTFADNFRTKPDINYNKSTTDVGGYLIGNYTANAYFNAQPNEFFSLLIAGGVGFQYLTTPSGTILYEEVYSYNNYGVSLPTQSALVNVKSEVYTPVVFHLGFKANWMLSEAFGLNFFGDYHYAKHKFYPDERHNQFSGGLGLIYVFPEIY